MIEASTTSTIATIDLYVEDSAGNRYSESFDCNDERGVTGFTIAPGPTELYLAPGCAQGTPVVTVALSIASFTYGGLLGGFFLALLWRRAMQRDAILGMATGILAMTFVVFARPLSAAIPALAGPLEPLTRIAWPWYVLIGTSITMLVGVASYGLLARASSSSIRWATIAPTTPTCRRSSGGTTARCGNWKQPPAFRVRAACRDRLPAA